MGDLSKNFSKKELACKCCGKFILSLELIAGLQELRDRAKCPLHINSGTRCSKHNKEVGGTSNSQHLFGRAADVWADNLTPQELYKLAENIKVFRDGGIGLYNTFIHVDVRRGRSRWDYR